VKQLDWYLGGWSTQVDPDTVRRNLYGKSGAMRFKPYGVEYRVLSNFWLTSADRKKQMWNRLQQGIWDMNQRYMPDLGNKAKRGFTFSNANAVLRDSIDNSTPLPTDFRYGYEYPIFSIRR